MNESKFRVPQQKTSFSTYDQSQSWEPLILDLSIGIVRILLESYGNFLDQRLRVYNPNFGLSIGRMTLANWFWWFV